MKYFHSRRLNRLNDQLILRWSRGSGKHPSKQQNVKVAFHFHCLRVGKTVVFPLLAKSESGHLSIACNSGFTNFAFCEHM